MSHKTLTDSQYVKLVVNVSLQPVSFMHCLFTATLHDVSDYFHIFHLQNETETSAKLHGVSKNVQTVILLCVCRAGPQFMYCFDSSICYFKFPNLRYRLVLLLAHVSGKLFYAQIC